MGRFYLQRAASRFGIVRGEVVRQLQLSLAEARDDTGTVDGVFGSDTENAIKAFQTKSGHTITGKIIDQTWSALMQLIDARKSPSISMEAVFK